MGDAARRRVRETWSSSTRHPRRALAVLAFLLMLTPAVASPGLAQDDPDFLFGRPTVTLGLHGGWSMPVQSSEIFEFVREELTVDPGAFDSFTFGGEVSWRWTERLDLSVTLEHASASVPSEFRDWVDLEDRPIEQTTSLRRVPFTLSLKAYLMERGRRISELAWIPRDWSPYVGAGAGVLWYDFEQEGDFVDFETLDIFRDRFSSEGAVPTAHVLAGLQYSLSERFVVRGEYRYAWASAELSDDFVGFEPLDLGGGRITVGAAVRFSAEGARR